MPHSTPAVELKNVDIAYMIPNAGMLSFRQYLMSFGRDNLFQRKEVLQNISFKINKGTCFGILGTNGSGKSSLMRIIAGVLEPEKGTITVDGRISPVLGIGIGVEHELTGYENIKLCCTLLRYPTSLIKELTPKIKEFSELSDIDLSMQVKKYSSGMIARLGFSIATAHVPDILIIDEALSVGDLAFQQKCKNRIAELLDQGKTVILVTQNPEEFNNICTDGLIVDAGNILQFDTVQQTADKYMSLLNEKREIRSTSTL